MADLSRIKLNGTYYNFKDAEARTTLTENDFQTEEEVLASINNTAGRLTPYGYCQTAAATVAKEVTVSPAPIELASGLRIAVKFQYANTSTNPTINVNNLGAIAIKRYGTTAAGTSAASNWNANSVVTLTYDGTYWQLTDFNNTTYSGMTDAEVTAGTGTSNRLITPARLKTAIETWAPAAPVTSINGQTGAVTVTEDDHKWGTITYGTTIQNVNTPYYVPVIYPSNTSNGTSSLMQASPTPTAYNIAKYDNEAYLKSTTPSANDNSTKVATTAYVDAAIPSVPSWALESTKPTYTASEVGALPDTYTAPVTSVNGQTGAVTITDSDEKVKYTDLNGTNSGKPVLFAYSMLSGTGSSSTNTIYTSNKILWNDYSGTLDIYNSNRSKYVQINGHNSNISFPDSNSSYRGTLKGGALTAGRIYTLPDATGTIALTSDIDKTKLQTTAGSDNTEYNLIGTETSNTNNSVVNIYNPGSISFAKTTNEGRLTIGSSSLPGKIRLYSNVTNATGYTDLVSGATSTNTRTITFPDATGTVALTTDIPSVPSWAMQSSKPSYAFSELTSHPTTINDYGITDAYTKTEVDGLVSGVLHYKGAKANTSALPSSGNAIGDVWHITADGSEWAWDGTEWQELGSTVDLSGYLQTGDIAAWAKASTKPSYTASEVGALPSNTTYVSTFNGQSGAITYIPPVTSVNGQTGAVTITIPDNNIYVVTINGTVDVNAVAQAYHDDKLIIGLGSDSGGLQYYTLTHASIGYNPNSVGHLLFTRVDDDHIYQYTYENSTWSYTSSNLALADHIHSVTAIQSSNGTNTAIASGDRLTFIDTSDSNKIKSSTITFGSSSTQFLANDGTWQSVSAADSDVIVVTYGATDVTTRNKIVNNVYNNKLLMVIDYDDTDAAYRFVSRGNNLYYFVELSNNRYISYQDNTSSGTWTKINTRTYFDNSNNTGVTVASGDKLIIVDASDGYQRNTANITFGSSTTQYLANNGTWQNIPTAYDDTALAARVTALEQTAWYRYYTGSNEPNNSMGNNGDLYFQTE